METALLTNIINSKASNTNVRVGKRAWPYYFILFTAYLNAVLRLSPESDFTLFRVMLPITLVMIALCSLERFFKLCLAVAGLAAISAAQYWLAANVFYPDITFSATNLIIYLIHYSSIFVVFAVVLCIKQIEGAAFFKGFLFAGSVFIKIALCIAYVYIVGLNNPPSAFRLAGNINNFACMMVAGLAVILIQIDVDKKKRNYVWALLIILLLYYNDSKAALFGGILLMGIYIAIKFSENTKGFALFGRRLIVLAAVIMLLAVLVISPSISGYDLSSITVEPIKRIVSNDPFPAANTSLTYRTNSTLAAFNIIGSTYGLGVGAGNTGVVLRHTIDNLYSSWMDKNSISLHNWWLEAMCDFGWVAILPGLWFFFKEVFRFFYLPILSKEEKFRMILFLSFPVWSISASGLYTEFFTLSVIFVCLVFGDIIKRKIKNVQNAIVVINKETCNT